MKKVVKKEEVYNFLLSLAKEISKRKSGALFVIAPNNSFKNIFEQLYPQVLSIPPESSQNTLTGFEFMAIL